MQQQDYSQNYMSLYDFLNRPGGMELGGKVNKAFKEKYPGWKPLKRHVETKTYAGFVDLYPKSFLDEYFKETQTSFNFYKMSLAEDIEYWEGQYDPEEYIEDDSIFKKYIEGKLYWKRKDGIKVLVQDMPIQHILNCMRIPLYRNKENWDKIFEFELKIRKL